MTPEQFVFWLKGFLDGYHYDDESLSFDDVVKIELDKMIIDQLDPSHYHKIEL